MNVEGRKNVVRRLIEQGINAWDSTVIDESFTGDVLPRAREDFSSFKRSFPDWTMEVVDVVAEGDVVVARFKCRGTHLGRWMGTEPTGRRMEVDEVFYFWFDDGRIREMWSLEDTLTRQEQLGF